MVCSVHRLLNRTRGRKFRERVLKLFKMWIYRPHVEKYLKTYSVYCKRRLELRKIGVIQKRFATSVISKDINGPFPIKYNPDDVENGWYDWWLQQGLFAPNGQHIGSERDNAFSMVLPPPNVTGDLHLGHALTVAIQDSLARWRRAKGDNVLWVPGYDHAGIATQVVIEKKLKAETGRLRHQISRQEFIRETNAWKDKKVSIIERQLQSLGASLDWSRQCFTMDQKFEKSVLEAFVRLYEGGFIERQTRLVNWCCHLQSAISDIEVDNVSVDGGDKYRVPGCDEAVNVGLMIYFAYPIHNSGKNEEVIVGTTRPETLFGDVALAVHPNDNRYTHLIGRRVVHPFDGRLLPIVADDSVLPQLGSGCVKITPAHDHNDFQLAERHQLPMLNIMDIKGCLTVDTEPFKGLSRFKAREVVINELHRLGLLRDQQNINTTIPVCSRTGDIVEPMLKAQWYLDCSDMYIKLIEEIKSGQFNVQPEASKISLVHWLSEKRKWCISRQLWWGHQIPAYRITHSDKNDEDEHWVVARTLDEAVRKASDHLNRPVAAEDLKRDEDVLDTWFSSALFPFAAFGWPTIEDKLFEKFYPLSLMETGHDIIFFWVARMAVLGEMLTGKKPFSQVLVHGLICDAHGRKMSKSLGNVIDPQDIQRGVSLKNLCDQSSNLHKEGYINAEELKTALKCLSKDFPKGIQQCGTDALRFALLSHDIKGQFINLSVSYVESCKPFCNKIWQTCRFYLLHSEKNKFETKPLEEVKNELSLFDRWILSHLSAMVRECNVGFDSSEFHMVTTSLRRFWNATLCDVYLEGIKPTLFNETDTSQARDAILTTLLTCIQVGVVAVAPIMPFLAEELYQRLKLWGANSKISVSLNPYPDVNQWETWSDPQLESLMEEVLKVASMLRHLRVKYHIPKLRPQVYVTATDGRLADFFNQLHLQLEALGGCRLSGVSTQKPSLTKTWICRDISPDLSVAIDILELIDVSECRKELMGEKLSIEKKLKQLNEDIAKPNYLSQAKHSFAVQKINNLSQELSEIENSILELNK